jgi:hypothetical protein
VHALVTAEHVSVAIANLAPGQGRASADELRMFPRRDEADLLAVGLLRDGEAEAARRLSDGRLVETDPSSDRRRA